MATRSKARLKKGDTVKVITGRDKGLTGVIQSINLEAQKVVVSGVNKKKKAIKPNPMLGITGGHMEIEAPIHISNVMYFDTPSETATRLSYTGNGREKARFAKRLDKALEE